MLSMSQPGGVIVIGAGAAGLMAAVSAGRLGARVLILESGRKPGTKILASGGSRCNLTHDEVLPEDYNGGSRNVIARLLREVDARAARQFFEDLGVATKLEVTGKVFPVSNSAVTVRDALVREALRVGAVLKLETPVHAIHALAEGGYTVKAETGESFRSDRVVLATGGLSYPTTGSTGDGLRWAAGLGHTIVPTIPALVPLLTNDSLAHSLSGVTLEAELILRKGEKGKELRRVTGSLLFTHMGLSGPAALNMSRHYTRAREAGAAWGGLSFEPGRSVEEMDGWLVRAAGDEPRKNVQNLMGTLVPNRVAEAVCERAGIHGSARISELRREERRDLARTCVEWPLGLAGTLGYDKAEVTAGGVDLSEVDPSTMESRKHPGLYFCGEVLDVDGKLGGYNFQWAWSSGYVAGRGAAATGG